MKQLLFTVAALGLVSISKAESKVGYVDLQKAIQATTVGKKAKTELETEFNKKKKELEAKESDLKKMGDDLERKKSVLSEEVFARKQGELQEEMLKYREVVGKSQLEIQKKERDLTAPILEKMKAIVEKVASAKSYDLVLEKAEHGILFSKKENDLTDAVVAEFEKTK